ncbi:hypothetical protein CEP88_11080 [Roseobacter denitrificans]|uniref:Regulatory protein Ppa n=1 Tax=Roseobacter denitrificans (strain ATCC 33942 / OCh 114) TaxID=375451 RepID=Q16DR7_ROSDO|nr:cobalamin-dependent protein [Roseobacter denitrificans]ABG29876.1 regulatory protein Ppa [Roseobacter denitrificans OCh 114]AVL53092.1 hypothetical protein CEP88_11080 [Roseobacter denitrificans]SFG25398.1 B12 binding domain-containing protein [Roseobacter denitrificans OCh 114]
MSTDDQTDPRGVMRNRPDSVDVLASTVISVLRDRQAVSCEGLRQFVLDQISSRVLSKKHFAPDVVLAELRGYRLSVDAIIDLYVPAAARMLGEQWVDDKISFADVTIGTMRLQALLADASGASCVDHKVGAVRLNALVVIPQNEQHFLGASVVAAQLRRLGCEVAMSYDEDHGALTARLINDVPDLVLVTCGRLETLPSVANTIQVVRKAVGNDPTLAVGGACQVNKQRVMEITGADIVTSVAEEAVAHCLKYVNSPSTS